ncbi:MAG: glutathione S-transferase family protein [Nostocaceae cyanobacterium]|nr:glutathione S-transferase family protein [Nostocaceae cyanobacterium]
MLTLYHAPMSANSRRVWITLLEKGLEFELVEMQLGSEQFQQPEFLALNPFHHIPVLLDDGFRIIESLAILDYLEAKYPIPAMLPSDAKDLAIVRMVQMVSVNELLPAIQPLSFKMMGIASDSEKIEQALQQVNKVLTLFESLLSDSPYFGSQHLTFAEVVAGTLILWLPRMGDVALDDYPKLNAWSDRLTQRQSWQMTHPSPEEFEATKLRLQARMGV